MAKLSEIQQLVRDSVTSSNQQNFECDGFAKQFQDALARQNVEFDGRMVVLKRSEATQGKGVREEAALAKEKLFTKVVMRDSGHEFHEQVIGNQTHFWTEVETEDQGVYCFDNLHPEGIPKAEFYVALEFKMQKFLGDDEPHGLSRQQSTRTNFSVDDIHAHTEHEAMLSHTVLLLKTSIADYRSRVSGPNINWAYRPEKTFKPEHIGDFPAELATCKKQLQKMKINSTQSMLEMLDSSSGKVSSIDLIEVSHKSDTFYVNLSDGNVYNDPQGKSHNDELEVQPLALEINSAKEAPGFCIVNSSNVIVDVYRMDGSAHQSPGYTQLIGKLYSPENITTATEKFDQSVPQIDAEPMRDINSPTSDASDPPTPKY